jgi:hypothetical protein
LKFRNRHDAQAKRDTAALDPPAQTLWINKSNDQRFIIRFPAAAPFEEEFSKVSLFGLLKRNCSGPLAWLR